VRRLLHRIYRGATAIVANTKAQARYVAADADVPLERVQVVYDGVDLARHHAPGMLDGLRERVRHRPLVIGGAGSADPGRRLFHAVAARIAARHPDAHFVWLEDGADRSGVATVDLPNGSTVRVVAIDEDPVPVLSQLALVCLAGAAVDLVPAVMAAARPIVASGVPGIDELVTDGATGIVAPAGDPGAFATAALGLLEDRGRLRSFGQAARAEAERLLGADGMARATAAVYEAALLGRPNPGAAFGARMASAAPEDGLR
jgi:glycosyltransferase involved in cell wall biosynthesis